VRLAKILHTSSPAPVLAIEHAGELHLVSELDRFYRTRFAPDHFDLAGDFRTRVLGLGLAGLFELDERLRNGFRPDAARIQPGSFTWLPPCDPERATYVQVDAFDAHDPASDFPGYRVASARSLRGHDESIPFPTGEDHPALEVGVAAVLREELRRATADEARSAILGVTLVCEWVAPSRWQGRWPGPSHDFAPQIGPVLVTPDDVPQFTGRTCRVERSESGALTASIPTPRFSLPEAIAYVSQHVDLLAGDVVSVGPVPLQSGPGDAEPLAVQYGERVHFSIEGLGELCGRPVRGPTETRWRR